ncbi:MAG: amidohydrolase family protein [Spirochaetales bacterium]|nr:amidohydrolase family protein [Spirochaetales bacterium]
MNYFSMSNLTVVSPTQIFNNSSIKINKNKIDSLNKTAKYDIKMDRDIFCYPAIINIHDHLRGDYLPKVGPRQGNYYLNWSYWDNDLKSSEVYVERANISVDNCYLLGAYKNLFSGAVTVNDHFPHEFNEPFIPRLPVRVISEYTLAHECSSYDLKWGDGIKIEHKRAVERNYPFITHLEEGFDRESQRGIEILEELECLDDHDVLIHCIGFSEEDIKKAGDAGSHIVWCPVSNMFMFNVTCKIRKMIKEGLNISIGTDSTHTGSVNILEEMKYARKLYRQMYGEDLPAKRIVEMVTVNPAKALRMDDRIGSISSGKDADLLLIRAQNSDPYEAFVNLNMENIELLLQSGIPLYGAKKYMELFHLRNADYTEISVKGKRMLVKGDPVFLMKNIREAVGYNKRLDFIPIDD